VRRLAIVVLGVALAAAILLLNAIVFTARDKAPVQSLSGPGEAFPDQCAAHHVEPSFRFNSDPPTSGPHIPRSPAREEGLTRDVSALLQALELGNVVIVHPSRHPPAALTRLQNFFSGPFTSELAGTGQALILTSDPRIGQITALAWRHRLRAASADDPRLREFADFWLGRGYAQARGENCPAAG
jgi:hypothetical protein